MSTLTSRRSADPATPSTRVGPLGRLARITFRRRGRTVLAWLGVLVVAVLLSMSLGGDFTADYSAPGSDSKEAQTLLEDRFPSQARTVRPRRRKVTLASRPRGPTRTDGVAGSAERRGVRVLIGDAPSKA